MKVTSAGIIRNEENPRVGVTSELSSEFFDLVDSEGVNLSYEEYQGELEEDDSLTDEEREESLSNFENDSSNWLVGDWKKVDGKYEVDREGKNGFAATYSNENGVTACVEFSKTTVKCHHTSPCYMMGDGSGPCGDLDTEGDSVVAYSLPEEYTADKD